MSQIKFTPAPHGNLSRDMIELKGLTNGAIGILSAGNQKTGVVLRLAPNLYATTENVSHSMKVLADMDKSDIHVLKSRADMVHFTQRYTLFKRGEA